MSTPATYQFVSTWRPAVYLVQARHGASRRAPAYAEDGITDGIRNSAPPETPYPYGMRGAMPVRQAHQHNVLICTNLNLATPLLRADHAGSIGE